MTATVVARRVSSSAGKPVPQAASIGLLLGLSGITGFAVASPALLRAAVSLAAATLLLAACLKAPRRTLIVLLVWLTALGTVRRLLLASGAAADSDPLLLVAPAVVALLLVTAARRGAFLRLTRLSKCVLGLALLTAASALNPLQGGLAVGAGGLLFVLVPILWFWIGRAIVDTDLMTRILRLVGILSLVAAGYGLFQVYSGFPSWDQHWIAAKGYTALHVAPGALRPFASFSSSSEYVGLLSIGIIVWACRLVKRSEMLRAGAAITVLGWALTVASVRGALVIVPIALGVTLAAARGFGLMRTTLVGLAALFVLGFVVTRLDPGPATGSATAALVGRSITGLSDPLDPKVSTLPAHIEALISGLREAAQNPLGNGVGVVTIAADKYGSANASTDVDPSNVAVAMGIPGLLAYGAVVLFALGLAFHQARRSRDFLSLAVLGIALVTLLQWLNGGNYAVAPLPWLVLGWSDAQASSARMRLTAAAVLRGLPA